MKKQSRLDLFTYPSAFLLLIFCFLILYSNSYTQLFIFNSDQLTIPSLAEDILNNPNFSIFTWMIPRAPYFFPDLLVYFMIRCFTSDTYVAVFIMGFWHLVLMSIAARLVLRLAMPNHSSANFAWLFFLIICGLTITAARFEQTDTLLLHPFIPIAHGTAAISAFIAFVAYERFIVDGTLQRRPIAILLCSLAIFSDKFFAVYFYLPYVASILLTSPAAAAARRIGVFVLEAAVSFLLAIYIERLFVLQAMDPIEIKPIERLTYIANIFLKLPFPSLLLFSCALPALIVVAILGRSRKSLDALPASNMRARIFLSVLTGCGLGVGILLWREEIPPYSRYLVGMQLGGIALIAVLLADWTAKKQGIRWGMVCVAITACLLALFWKPFSTIQAPFLERERSVQALEVCREKLKLKTGLASYWNARKLSGMTDWNVQINQLEPAYPRPFFWGSNLLWFYYDLKSPNPSTTNFIISNGLKLEDVELNFGKPSREQDCGDYHVLVYDQPGGLTRRISQILDQIAVTSREEQHFPEAFVAHKYLGPIDLSTMHQQTGKLIDGTAVAISPVDTPGYLLFGPYFSLSAGNYIVDIRYSCADNDTENTFDVVANLGQLELRTAKTSPRDMRCDGVTRTLALPFSLSTPVKNIEFRSAFGGTGAIRVYSLNLRSGTTDTPPVEVSN